MITMYQAIGIMFSKAICAGMCISLGCIAFLMAPDKLSGSVLFSVGLLGVVVHKLFLFTGSVCSMKIEPFWTSLPIWERFIEYERQGGILLGNIIGVCIAAMIFLNTGIETGVSSLVDNKLSADVYAVFCKAILCNILICLAVDEWRKQKNSLMVIFAVSVFVLCGFEHCVANAFYMIAAGRFDIGFFVINVLGNAIGGIGFWRVKHFIEFDDDEEESK